MYNKLTSTYPIIAHFPGNKECKQYLNLYLHTIKPAQKFKLNSNTCIVSWNSSNNISLLEKSINKLTIECNYKNLTTGTDSKWEYMSKIYTLLPFLKNNTYDYIIGLDGYDCLLLDNPNLIVEKFNELSCNLLFNATNSRYPDYRDSTNSAVYPIYKDISLREEKLIAHINTPWKFLNSGAWVCKSKYLYNYIQECIEIYTQLSSKYNLDYHSKSDQLVYRYLYSNNYPEIDIDYNCKIFQVFKKSLFKFLDV